MANYSDWTTAVNAVANPYTTPQELLSIAQAQPRLMAQVAAHPNAYPDLLNWLDSFRIPEVSAMVAARRGQTQPRPQPQPRRAVPVRRKMNPLMIALIAVLAVALVGTVIYFATRGSPDLTPPSTTPATQTASQDPTPTVTPANPIVPGISVYGGTGLDSFVGNAVTADNEIVHVGWTDSTDGDFPWMGSEDDGGVVAKTGPDGSLLWAYTYGGKSGEIHLRDVTVTDDGSIIVVGYTAVPNTHTSIFDALVMKLDSEGKIIWTYY